MIPKSQKIILLSTLLIVAVLAILTLGTFRFGQQVTAAPTSVDVESCSSEIDSIESPVWSSGLEQMASDTPLGRHGALTVSGTQLLDEKGDPVQLRGVSTHHYPLYTKFINPETLGYIRDEWGVDLLRLATYTEFFGAGYCDVVDTAGIDELIENALDLTRDLGMYVILDWHTLQDNNPLKHVEEAKKFFEYYSGKYSKRNNIIYEICNEPNSGTTWKEITEYANTIIPIIRRNDPDAVILVAPAGYATDLESVAKEPLDYDNIMYTTHFYAGSHKEANREKVTVALEAGLPVFISECNITEALMQGKVDFEEGEKWFELIDSNQLSYAVWSFSDCDEVFSFLEPGTEALSNFSEDDLTQAGLWHEDHFRSIKATP